MEGNADSADKEGERRHSNTEYTPTKCRITKPQPPKPVQNPMQFVQVRPCDLYRTAQEQIKKVERIRATAKDVVKEEAEDWQYNLDNWKSNRRKQQEQIIERVVEVKKLEQEEHNKNRRKVKTFNEILEEKGRSRLSNFSLYADDDGNDLSDLGISRSNSKNSDSDSNSIDTGRSTASPPPIASPIGSFRSPSHYDKPSPRHTPTPKPDASVSPPVTIEGTVLKRNYSAGLTPVALGLDGGGTSGSDETCTYESAIDDYRLRIRTKINADESIFTRSTSSNSVSETRKSKEYSEAQQLLPKGNIGRRKELFDRSLSTTSSSSATVSAAVDGDGALDVPITPIATHRLSEDFVHSQSIKERLQCLQNCKDQAAGKLPVAVSENIVSSVKSKVLNFTKQQADEVVELRNGKNGTGENNNSFSAPAQIKNNYHLTNNNSHNANNNNTAPNTTTANKATISSYLLDNKSNSGYGNVLAAAAAAAASSAIPADGSDVTIDATSVPSLAATAQAHHEYFDRSASPDSEIFMNKLNEFHRDLDSIYGSSTSGSNKAPSSSVDLPHYLDVFSSPSPASAAGTAASVTSSTDLMMVSSSSDKEDSGIHTTDVSCSVSQADDTCVDDQELVAAIPPPPPPPPPPQQPQLINVAPALAATVTTSTEEILDMSHQTSTLTYVIDATQCLLAAERKCAFLPDAMAGSERLREQDVMKSEHSPLVEHIAETMLDKDMDDFVSSSRVIYENVELKPHGQQPAPPNQARNLITTSATNELYDSLHTLNRMEPPKVKPPPPPPSSSDEDDNDNGVEDGSDGAARFRNDLDMKRTSFLRFVETNNNNNNITPKEQVVTNQQLEKKAPIVVAAAATAGNREICDNLLMSAAVDGRMLRHPNSEQTTPISVNTRQLRENVQQQSAGSNSSTTALDAEQQQQLDAVALELYMNNGPYYGRPGKRNGIDHQQLNQRHSYDNTEYLQLAGMMAPAAGQQGSKYRGGPSMIEAAMSEKPLSLDEKHSGRFKSLSSIGQDGNSILLGSNTMAYYKSMPDIQHAYNAVTTAANANIVPTSVRGGAAGDVSLRDIKQRAMGNRGGSGRFYGDAGVHTGAVSASGVPLDHRKSMPELALIQHNSSKQYQHQSQLVQSQTALDFSSIGAADKHALLNFPPSPSNSSTCSSGTSNCPLIGGKSVHPYGAKESREKDRFLTLHPVESDALRLSSNVMRPVTRYGTQLQQPPAQAQAQHPFAAVARTQPLVTLMTRQSSEPIIHRPSHHHHHHHHNALAQQQQRPAQPKSTGSPPIYDNCWPVEGAAYHSRHQPSNIHSHYQPASNAQMQPQQKQFWMTANSKPNSTNGLDPVPQALGMAEDSSGVGPHGSPLMKPGIGVAVSRNNNYMSPKQQPHVGSTSNMYANQPYALGHVMPFGGSNGSAAGAGVIGTSPTKSGNGSVTGLGRGGSEEGATSAADTKLKVSGKKKCSLCNLELGRGAAMIIESLSLFYHMACFKCCVCCIPLGDGLIGTDVRVRNDKLHCHNCYSSDDGDKFSCV